MDALHAKRQTGIKSSPQPSLVGLWCLALLYIFVDVGVCR